MIAMSSVEPVPTIRTLDLTPVTSRPPARPLAALGALLRVIRDRPDVVVARVAGGTASLITFLPVVTILEGRPEPGNSRLRSLLERLQARRSALLYAADRETAVAYALPWRLDLSRIRLAELASLSPQVIEHELRAAGRGKRSWHSI